MLHLDFNLTTQKERADFVSLYLENYTPTSAEIEKIANYILWGQNDQPNDFTIPTKHSTWNDKQPESLEGLYESETFSEMMMHPLNATHYVVRKEPKFSRTEARRNPYLEQQLEPLWQRIDHLDLLICFYDLAHNRRTKPPRPELLAHFTETEQAAIQEASTHLNQFQYLKYRHQLVELRSEQYAIADQFKPSMVRPHNVTLIEERPAEMPFFAPLDLCAGNTVSSLIFRPFVELTPSSFNEDQLALISHFIWSPSSRQIVDLQNEEVLAQLILSYVELREDPEFHPLLQTLDYYITETNFEPLYQDILSKKIQHVRNQDIAAYINHTYEKSYTINYISTIFHKKLIPEIAATIQQHFKIVSNLFFPENFKTCNTCGKPYLINDYNFVKKTRSADG